MTSISRQNGYVESDGTIRLYFTLEQAQTKLHRSRQSATRIFRELEYSGLIIRRKQGLGKPALITLNYPADAKLIAKEGKILPDLRQGHSPTAEGKIRPQTAVWCRQLEGI